MDSTTRGLLWQDNKKPATGTSKHIKGGYKTREAKIYNKSGELKKSEQNILTCPICLGILRDPVQIIVCGCRVCQSCIDDVINKSGNNSDSMYKCPVDRETFTLSDVRKDKGCAKEVNSLQVDCPTEPTPCDWKGPITKMEEHENNLCPNVEVPCKNGCGMKIQRSKLETHSSVCTKQPTECQYCFTTVAQDFLVDHLASCPMYPVQCDYCQKRLAARKELTNHLNKECTECEMTCPTDETTPCKFKGKKSELTEHVVQQHLVTSIETINELKNNVEDLTIKNEKLEEKVTGLETNYEILQAENKQMRQQMLEMQKHFEDHLRRMEIQFRQKSDFVERDSCGKTKRRGKKYASYEDAADYDERDCASMKSVSKLRDDVENHQSQLLRLSDDVQHIQENFTQFGILVDELRLRQDVLDVKTTNGVFIWKIPDIRRRYHDAVDRRTLSLYSPPFYTSPHGYRMCIRTYLNGDGSGKGSHVSVFFVLMKSEHDSLLPWPFRQPVRFTLINQVDSSANITEAFAPDLHSPSFQRPQAEMNVASGFPQFAKQTVLHDERFTKGNMIFIKAQIDLNGLNLQ